MKDIKFYDFNFNLLRILPQYAFNLNCGYISANVTKEFNGAGSFEIDFIDEETKQIVKSNPRNIFIEWNGFFGILTGYLFDTKCKITGLSLNSLLHRIVIPQTATQLSGNVEQLARNAISVNGSWLTLGTLSGYTNQVQYSTDTYKTADVYIEELLALDNAGYEISADIANRHFVFKVLSSSETGLILSTNLNTAYDFSESYDNKSKAVGGWYQRATNDDSVWTYITTDNTASGINKIDTVLSATTEAEALQELQQLKEQLDIDLKTRNVKYGTDYKLGDIVRVQNGERAVKKRIIGINITQENGYTENPILSEVI